MILVIFLSILLCSILLSFTYIFTSSSNTVKNRTISKLSSTAETNQSYLETEDAIIISAENHRPIVFEDKPKKPKIQIAERTFGLFLKGTCLTDVKEYIPDFPDGELNSIHELNKDMSRNIDNHFLGFEDCEESTKFNQSLCQSLNFRSEIKFPTYQQLTKWRKCLFESSAITGTFRILYKYSS